MKVLFSCLIAALMGAAAVAGVSGSFRGTVVNGPESSDRYVYVQGRNHSIRRVDVSRANIHYDSDVPAGDRKSPAPHTLAVGTQVRVTAEQDAAGEWRASEIEILKGESSGEEKKATPPVTSQS